MTQPLRTRLILYTGKGGTGKSVISCATAIKCASRGYKTLVISADPAHTLSDALGIRIGDEPTRVTEDLWGVQIDPVKEMKRNYLAIQDYLASVFSARGIDETLAYEVASLPTMTSLFSLLKVDELMREEKHQIIVMDTVSSGEALRYIYFPKLIGSVSRKLMRLAGPVLGLAKVLEPILGVPAPTRGVVDTQLRLIERFEELAQTVRDVSSTSLRLVANPDSFSIENTRRALMVANLYGINVDLIIMNKIIPEEVKDPYFAAWKALQSRCLRESEVSFYPIPVKRIRLFEKELAGLESLGLCGDHLFGDEDPADVYHRGSPFEIRHDKRGLILKVRVPFTEKDDFDIERVGEELIMRVRSDVGEVVNVLPLPTATLGMSLARAKLLNGELNLHFVRTE